MQQFLHQVDHSSNNDEISEEGLQKVLEQNYSKSSNSEQEVEIPRSSLHTIMHKTSNQPSLVEEEVPD